MQCLHLEVRWLMAASRPSSLRDNIIHRRDMILRNLDASLDGQWSDFVNEHSELVVMRVWRNTLLGLAISTSSSVNSTSPSASEPSPMIEPALTWPPRHWERKDICQMIEIVHTAILQFSYRDKMSKAMHILQNARALQWQLILNVGWFVTTLRSPR